MPSIPANFEVVPSLDGLRALSILLVLGQHVLFVGIPGKYGVFAFFLISGFLISRLLFAEMKAKGKVSLAKFYIRRALRLYPIILLYTALTCAFFIGANLVVPLIEPISVLLYFANYVDASYATVGQHFTMPFGAFWSLAVEEQFYIVFPIAFILLKGNAQRVFTIALLMCVLSPILRLAAVLLSIGALPTPALYFRTEFRLDALGYGILLAALCETKIAEKMIEFLHKPLTVASFLAMVGACIAIHNPFFRSTFADSVMGFALIGLITTAVFGQDKWGISKLLNCSPMIWIGKLSYSLYVWHIGILTLLRHLYPGIGYIAFAALSLTTIFAVASISYYWIERPVMGLRQRFGSRTAGEFGAT